MGTTLIDEFYGFVSFQFCYENLNTSAVKSTE